MKPEVYKFGGASIIDAQAIRNLEAIVRNANKPLVVVVSAMGYTTKKLEGLWEAYINTNRLLIDETFLAIVAMHKQVITDLKLDKKQALIARCYQQFDSLKTALNRPPSLDIDFEYDRLVSFGEIFSTLIVAAYLQTQSYHNCWIDIGQCLKTDNTHREALIDWELSEHLIKQTFDFKKHDCYLTQGFIGATRANLRTTLGLEGSDFTAAILANILDAARVTFWKNVSGIFNADPARYPDAQPIPRISYKEAVEQTYYGAKVIHPKTIRPLQNKQIPLYVRSFIKPHQTGTQICRIDESIDLPPVYIIKAKQLLITLISRNFEFIAEQHLSDLYGWFARYRVRINLMQVSAISLSLCVDQDDRKITPLLNILKDKYQLRYNRNLTLLTIRHYSPESLQKLLANRKILVQQKSRSNARFVVECPPFVIN